MSFMRRFFSQKCARRFTVAHRKSSEKKSSTYLLNFVNSEDYSFCYANSKKQKKNGPHPYLARAVVERFVSTKNGLRMLTWPHIEFILFNLEFVSLKLSNFGNY